MGKGRILITGGAGFIGSHLADRLLDQGYDVRALDALVPQVHGSDRRRPEYLHRDVELQIGDVRDRDAVLRALDGVDAVFHFAAAVGVGQSMYEIAQYTSVNNFGTAVLLEALLKRPVGRLIVASSMSLYGEGLYRTRTGALRMNADRSRAQLQRGEWEPVDETGAPLEPLPTPESKTPALHSIYALSKYDQEQLCLIFGRAYQVPTVALRFFNVYGTRQALSNPYTGVLAIFGSRLINRARPLVFEDGLQRRDFVHVSDVAQACQRALETPAAAGEVFNVGSGRSFTIREVAAQLSGCLGVPELRAELAGKYRVGDVRHCFADITRAKQVLGYRPEIAFEEGLAELAEWLRGQVAVDRVSQMRAELEARGLTV
ncbi:MAG: NAD-dependent epimerase/dehydratase family protein [Myxococcaceae bacterium]|nr:NAD-dependent epimerase/dehydratase family protein [Myxococcaceae bacterium]